jgi:chemotaxis protein MotA
LGVHRLVQSSPIRIELIIGLVILLVIGLSFVISGSIPDSVLHFPSALLVIGGTIAASLLTFSGEEIIQCFRDTMLSLHSSGERVEDRIKMLVLLSQKVRSEGRLVLEAEAKSARDPFLAYALESAVDETDPIVFTEHLRMEVQFASLRRHRTVRILSTMASYAPTLGFIGTIIGLTAMLSGLENTEKLGPSMALALVTTLYGSLLSQIILLPLVGRVRSQNEEEYLLREATIEGLSGIIKDFNSIMINHRMKAFLP